jgi:hypothetical protein
MAIPAGQYKAKAIKGSAQLGETNNGNLQIAIDLEVRDEKSQPLKDPNGQPYNAMTTFLYFSGDAAPYSYERLSALGWKGKGPADITEAMDGIDTNEVDVRVTVATEYTDPKDGVKKMGQSKIEILTGAGKVVLAKPIDANTFKSRLAALGGGAPSNTPAASSGGGTAPPF